MADTPVDSSLPGLLSTGIQFGLNQSLQNELLQSSIDNLTQFAQSVDAQQYPDLLQEINSNIDLAQQGKISPAQMLAAVQQKSNLLGIKVPQQFTDTVNSALAQEQAVAKAGGYTPADRAALEQAFQGVVGQERGQQAAIAANQQARGQYGGGQALDQEQTALQGDISTAANTGNQVVQAGLARALAAMQNEGQLGLAGGQQSFGQQATVAGAQDAINQLNTTLQQQANTANMQANNAAIQQTAAQELAREQANQQAQLSLNQQRTGAQNQNVQNEQQGENIAVGALKQAGQDAASLAPAVYKQTQAGQSTLAQQLLGPTGSLSPLVTSAGKAISGALGGGNTTDAYGRNPSDPNYLTVPGAGEGGNPGYVPVPPDNSGGGTDTSGGDTSTGADNGGFARGGEVKGYVDGGQVVPSYQLPTIRNPQVGNSSNSDILGGILNQINGRNVVTTAANTNVNPDTAQDSAQNAMNNAFSNIQLNGQPNRVNNPSQDPFNGDMAAFPMIENLGQAPLGQAPQHVARNTTPVRPAAPTSTQQPNPFTSELKPGVQKPSWAQNGIPMDPGYIESYDDWLKSLPQSDFQTVKPTNPPSTVAKQGAPVEWLGGIPNLGSAPLSENPAKPQVFNIDGPRAQPKPQTPPRMTTQPIRPQLGTRAMMSTGGDVHGPGTETSDSIPVRLSNHEYVVNADSTKKYKPLIEAINNDDHEGILDSLMSICGPSKDCEVVVTGKGKKIDGQKALSDALRAMSKGSDE